MNAPKFTPGPWEWFGNGDHCYLATPNRGRLYVMDFGRKGMQGATPRFSHWNRIGDGAERERSGGIMQDGHLLPDGRLHPDATLIAAAPELYQSLLEMVEDSDDVDDGELPRIAAATLARARQALAKAAQA